MLTINIICIGKLKEEYLRMSSAEYQKRLSAFCKLNIIELSEYKLSNEPSASMVSKAIEIEGENIIKKLKGEVISLCIEGAMLSSEELSARLLGYALNGASELSFVIGGSNGLFEEVKAQSSLKLSMSRMTFPHQLARIMLLEQIYRAFQISSNSKYHK